MRGQGGSETGGRPGEPRDARPHPSEDGKQRSEDDERSGAPAALRGLVRALLALYPGAFRREFGRAYRVATEHRWRREAARGRGASRRTALVLLADAAGALPACWREARVERRRASDATARVGRHGPEGVGGKRGRPGPAALAADFKLALRGLVRRPGFSGLVVVTLGLGIGASSAIVGVLDRFILHPLPFADGERMAFLGLQNVEHGFVTSPTQEILERWTAGSATVEALAVFRDGTALVPSGDGAPRRMSRRVISGGLPALVGLRPVLGRALGPDDARPDAEPAVMLGEGTWRRAFGADRDVIGRTVSFNDSTFTVVGVWPAAATLDFDDEPALWTTIPAGEEANPSSFTKVLAVLARGVHPDEVRAELAALIEGLDSPRTNAYAPTVLAPHFFLGDDFVEGLWIASAGVVLLLVVAVLNASSLLLNRAVTRGGEIGVRLALGASGRGLVRLFVLEAFVLTLAGAMLGVGVARWGGVALAAVAPERFPDLAPALGGRAAEWALAAAALATVLCGLVPALHLRSPEVRRLLEGRGATEGPRRGFARGGLVALQVALAVVLAVGAGLGFRSLDALASVDPGFDLEPLAVLSVSLPRARYPEPADQDAFMRRVDEALRSLPGVEGVAISGVPPFSFSVMQGEPTVVGEPFPEAAGTYTAQASASPGYFDVMGIPVLEGRGPTDEDARRGEGEPTLALVNEYFASRFAGSVVGREMRFPEWDSSMRIIGVVGNVRGGALSDDEMRVQYYVVDEGAGGSYTRFLIRSADPSGTLAAARSRIAELDPQLVPAEARTGRDFLRRQTADQRFLAILLGVFGALASIVAVLGVYGTVALAVSRRTREIGVRVALGAAVGAVVAHVLRLGLGPVLVGAVAGAGAAWVAGRFVSGALYRVGPGDPLSFGVALALLGGAATLACLVPARRALRVDPVTTLRSD